MTNNKLILPSLLALLVSTTPLNNAYGGKFSLQYVFLTTDDLSSYASDHSGTASVQFASAVSGNLNSGCRNTSGTGEIFMARWSCTAVVTNLVALYDSTNNSPTNVWATSFDLYTDATEITLNGVEFTSATLTLSGGPGTTLEQLVSTTHKTVDMPFDATPNPGHGNSELHCAILSTRTLWDNSDSSATTILPLSVLDIRPSAVSSYAAADGWYHDVSCGVPIYSRFTVSLTGGVATATDLHDATSAVVETTPIVADRSHLLIPTQPDSFRNLQLTLRGTTSSGAASCTPELSSSNSLDRPHVIWTVVAIGTGKYSCTTVLDVSVP
jgi:hypothetical protein